YRYYAKNGPDYLRNETIDDAQGGSAYIQSEPYGVLLGIMPWNFPYYQVARFAAPNLMIGNTVLLKHAGICPESAATMEQIFLDAGFPEGAYQYLCLHRSGRRDYYPPPGGHGGFADRFG